MKARARTTCSICNEFITKGEEISKFGSRWIHTECRVSELNKNLVWAEETYKSQRRSDYHRKSHHK